MWDGWIVPGRHQLSILSSSQAANELLTGNVAGHSGFREKTVSNDTQTWTVLLTDTEQLLRCNMELTQKGSEFLMNLSRNWTLAWPHAVFTAAKNIHPRCAFTSATSWLAFLLARCAASTGQRLLLGSP